jgi:hypothetical protein
MPGTMPQMAAMGMALLFCLDEGLAVVFSARILARLGFGRRPLVFIASGLSDCISDPDSGQRPAGSAPGALNDHTGRLVFCLLSDVTGPGRGGTTGVNAYAGSIASGQTLAKQNHMLLAVFFLFSLVVFINLAIVLFGLPYWAKTIFGYESIFTLSPFSAFNTTFGATVLSLTYLCVDPLVKTVYTLRCFDGYSMISGEDIRLELKDIIAGKQALAVLMLAMQAAVPAVGRCGENPELAHDREPYIGLQLTPGL